MRDEQEGSGGWWMLLSGLVDSELVICTSDFKASSTKG